MVRRGIVAVALLALALAACSDDEAKPSGTAAPIASDSPAPAPTIPGGTPAAAVDCGVLEPLVASAVVNIQLIAQLATITDVANWSVSVGSLPQFDSQLAAMAVLEPFDAGVAEQRAFFLGADEITQRGLGGDAGAPAELAAYLGDDLGATLARQIPFGAALTAAGC